MMISCKEDDQTCWLNCFKIFLRLPNFHAILRCERGLWIIKKKKRRKYSISGSLRKFWKRFLLLILRFMYKKCHLNFWILSIVLRSPSHPFKRLGRSEHLRQGFSYGRYSRNSSWRGRRSCKWRIRRIRRKRRSRRRDSCPRSSSTFHPRLETHHRILYGTGSIWWGWWPATNRQF